MPNKLTDLVDRHVVTAGDIAGGAIYGVFQPRTAVRWMSVLAIDNCLEEWELLSLECLLTDSAGVDKHGKMLALIALPIMGQQIHLLVQSTRCQYFCKRVGLAYSTFVQNGVAVLCGAVNCVAGDILVVSGLYRVVE